MKLYNVPNNTMVRVVAHEGAPLDARVVGQGEVVKFHHVDGMYSYCHDKDGNVIHLAAWTDVEIV